MLANFQSSLNCLSAFKFENFMQVLKKNVRSSINPVAQIVKRQSESAAHTRPKFSGRAKDCCFQLRNGKFCIINEWSENLIVTDLRGSALKSVYSKPAESSYFNIFYAVNLAGKRKTIERKELCRKVLCLILY